MKVIMGIIAIAFCIYMIVAIIAENYYESGINIALRAIWAISLIAVVFGYDYLPRWILHGIFIGWIIAFGLVVMRFIAMIVTKDLD